jgi:type I phosphodiesterase/nucleotide pyrophosphatase
MRTSPSIPTLTAVGHANVGTGTEPRAHGLVVNALFNRVTGKAEEAYDQLDPGELMALTLADVWNIHTNGAAAIIGQGGAIRATAGLVGHRACVINGRRVLAASYSACDGGCETNPKCYAMSEALTPFNARTYWQQAGGTWMGHDITSPTTFRHSAVFQRFEGDALGADAYGPDRERCDKNSATSTVRSPQRLASSNGKPGPTASPRRSPPTTHARRTSTGGRHYRGASIVLHISR